MTENEKSNPREIEIQPGEMTGIGFDNWMHGIGIKNLENHPVKLSILWVRKLKEPEPLPVVRQATS